VIPFCALIYRWLGDRKGNRSVKTCSKVSVFFVKPGHPGVTATRLLLVRHKLESLVAAVALLHKEGQRRSVEGAVKGEIKAGID